MDGSKCSMYLDSRLLIVFLLCFTIQCHEVCGNINNTIERTISNELSFSHNESVSLDQLEKRSDDIYILKMMLKDQQAYTQELITDIQSQIKVIRNATMILISIISTKGRDCPGIRDTASKLRILHTALALQDPDIRLNIPNDVLRSLPEERMPNDNDNFVPPDYYDTFSVAENDEKIDSTRIEKTSTESTIMPGVETGLKQAENYIPPCLNLKDGVTSPLRCAIFPKIPRVIDLSDTFIENDVTAENTDAPYVVPDTDSAIPDILHAISNAPGNIPNGSGDIPNGSGDILNGSRDIPNGSRDIPNIPDDMPNLPHDMPNLPHEILNVSHAIPELTTAAAKITRVETSFPVTEDYLFAEDRNTTVPIRIQTKHNYRYGDNTKKKTSSIRSAFRCPEVAKKIGSECFSLHLDQHKNWTSARSFCRSIGGDLAEPNLRNDRLPKMLLKAWPSLRSSEYWTLWVGATDVEKEGEWHWVTGGILDLEASSRWDLVEPPSEGIAQDCLAMILWVPGRWRRWDLLDDSCDLKWAVFCEHSRLF